MSSKDDLRNFQLQLDQVNDGLTLTPDDQELLDLKAELTDLIALLKEQLKSEEEEYAAKQRKWQTKKPAIIQSAVNNNVDSPIPTTTSDTSTQSPEPSGKPEHIIFKVGDIVSAKWQSGDG